VTDDLIKRTVVVYGALRSGTTLLRLMLNGHPRFNCPGEMDFIVDHLEDSGHYDMEALQANRIYRAHEASFPDHPLKAPTPQDFIARVSGPDQDVAVLILHRHLDQALDLFPDLKVVHLMRDPRDVARSSIGMGWVGNVYYGVDHWIGTMRNWEKALPKLPEGQRLIVSYEDLITNPEETLGKICAFSGLVFDPHMMSYDADSTYSKPDPSLTVQWKRKQTQREIGLVEGKIGPLLQMAGYDPSGHRVLYPGALARLGLWVENKRGEWRARITRYGVVNTVLLAVANKLNQTGLKRTVLKRIENSQIQHLK